MLSLSHRFHGLTQISCDFLGGFEKKRIFCSRLQSKNLKEELLWIHWIKNFGKNVKLGKNEGSLILNIDKNRKSSILGNMLYLSPTDLALLPTGQWVRRTNLPSAADFQFTD